MMGKFRKQILRHRALNGWLRARSRHRRPSSRLATAAGPDLVACVLELEINGVIAICKYLQNGDAPTLASHSTSGPDIWLINLFCAAHQAGSPAQLVPRFGAVNQASWRRRRRRRRLVAHRMLGADEIARHQKVNLGAICIRRGEAKRGATCLCANSSRVPARQPGNSLLFLQEMCCKAWHSLARFICIRS